MPKATRTPFCGARDKRARRRACTMTRTRPQGPQTTPCVKEIVSSRRGAFISLSLSCLSHAPTNCLGRVGLVPRCYATMGTPLAKIPKLRLLPRCVTLHYVTLHLSLIRASFYPYGPPSSSVSSCPTIRPRAFVAMVTPYPAT